jgi:hypothetical protein
VGKKLDEGLPTLPQATDQLPGARPTGDVETVLVPDLWAPWPVRQRRELCDMVQLPCLKRDVTVK